MAHGLSLTLREIAAKEKRSDVFVVSARKLTEFGQLAKDLQDHNKRGNESRRQRRTTNIKKCRRKVKEEIIRQQAIKP